MYVLQSMYLSIHKFNIFIYISIHFISTYVFLSICINVYLPIYQSVYLSFYLSIYLPSLCCCREEKSFLFYYMAVIFVINLFFFTLLLPVSLFCLFRRCARRGVPSNSISKFFLQLHKAASSIWGRFFWFVVLIRKTLFNMNLLCYQCWNIFVSEEDLKKQTLKLQNSLLWPLYLEANNWWMSLTHLPRCRRCVSTR